MMEALTTAELVDLCGYQHTGKCHLGSKERLIKMGCIDKETGEITEYGQRILCRESNP